MNKGGMGNGGKGGSSEYKGGKVVNRLKKNIWKKEYSLKRRM